MSEPGRKLTDAVRLGMFRAFATGSTITEIAEEFDTTPTTVRRYARRDEWDARVARIRAKSYKKIEKELITDTTATTKQTLNIIQEFKDKLQTRVSEMKPSALPVNLITQLESLTSLETTLIERLTTVEESGAVSELSDEQLVSILGDD